VRDSCVNQLLSKLDGVEEMNNVLVICLTNRKDLIDSALLRPGRLEVHIEIKAPTLEGREEILYILFKPMVLGGYVSFEDAKKWSRTLAERTFGYTGADLTGLLRNAASFAIERSLSQIQSDNRYQQRRDLSPEQLKVERAKNKLSLEKSIFILWEDLETAYLESSKELKISKRAKVNDFLRRKIFNKNQSKKDEEKVVRREFEDILNSVDFEADDLINVEDDEENVVPEDVVVVKPAFQNIGGTLIF
jgi:SpoVK/Ycf46/Vps4 family AAA+-type ATPase